MKMTKKWRPPLFCRWFGHRWHDTDVNGKISLQTSTLEICARCNGGRISTMLGWQQFTPRAVGQIIEEYEAEKELEENTDENVVPFREGKET